MSTMNVQRTGLSTCRNSVVRADVRSSLLIAVSFGRRRLFIHLFSPASTVALVGLIGLVSYFLPAHHPPLATEYAHHNRAQPRRRAAVPRGAFRPLLIFLFTGPFPVATPKDRQQVR